LAKNLHKQKSLLGQCEENESKKTEKRLLKRFVYQNLSITAKVGGFLAAVEALLKCYE
jgi:hypothetical protein